MGNTGKLDRKTIPVIKKLYTAAESNSTVWGRGDTQTGLTEDQTLLAS
jgi:hypothetical protein